MGVYLSVGFRPLCDSPASSSFSPSVPVLPSILARMSALRSTATRFINAPVSPSTLRGTSPASLKQLSMNLAARHDDHHGPTPGHRVGTPSKFALKLGRSSSRIGVNGSFPLSCSCTARLWKSLGGTEEGRAAREVVRGRAGWLARPPPPKKSSVRFNRRRQRTRRHC